MAAIRAGRDVRRPAPLSQVLQGSGALDGLSTRNPEAVAVAVAVAVACGEVSYRGVTDFIGRHRGVLEEALSAPLPSSDPTVRTFVRRLADARAPVGRVIKRWAWRYPLGPRGQGPGWPPLRYPHRVLGHFVVGSGGAPPPHGPGLRVVEVVSDLVRGGRTDELPERYLAWARWVLRAVPRTWREGEPGGVEGALLFFGETYPEGGGAI